MGCEEAEVRGEGVMSWLLRWEVWDWREGERRVVCGRADGCGLSDILADLVARHTKCCRPN